MKRTLSALLRGRNGKTVYLYLSAAGRGDGDMRLAMHAVVHVQAQHGEIAAALYVDLSACLAGNAQASSFALRHAIAQQQRGRARRCARQAIGDGVALMAAEALAQALPVDETVLAQLTANLAVGGQAGTRIEAAKRQALIAQAVDPQALAGKLNAIRLNRLA